MLSPANTRLLLVEMCAAVLLLCGGCAVTDQYTKRCDSPRPILHQGLLPGHAHRCQNDLECYGYRPTCWFPWPGECEGCPGPQAAGGDAAEPQVPEKAGPPDKIPEVSAAWAPFPP